MTWLPHRAASSYTFLTSEWKQDTFKYNFDDAKRNKFRKLKTSPYVNDEVNLLATECLYNARLGEDNVPDMLALTYYGGNYEHRSVLESSLEIQDMYVRLDKSIGDLLDAIDKKVGLHNTIFFITSTGYVDSEAPDLNKYRIPGGEFHINRCAALLNMYLMAIYGEGQYVEAYYGMELYFNHKLIEQKQLSLPEILSKSSDFLIQFSGVNDVYTSYRLLLGAWTPEIHKIRNSYNRKRSGDIIMDILPGWTAVRDNPQDNKLVRKSYIPSPLIFFGSSIKPEIIETPVNADCIAPTITGFMRIRAPNGCQTPSLTGISK